MEKLLLIDGNALLYKAFYASYFLLSQGEGLDIDGNPINALRTFSMMMMNLRQRFSEHHVLVAFDQKNLKTYRTEHSFYKEGRSKTPEELHYQKPLIEKFLTLFGFTYFSHVNFEADDIIGILAKKYSKEGAKIDIVTSDKDLLQLVDNNTSVHISKTGVSEMLEYRMDNFKELSNGLEPSQIKDLKGIMGDSSDNLKGIKGIGQKGAMSLLETYCTLENVIENVNDLSLSMQRKVNEGKELGILCKSIATIITEGDLGIELSDVSVKPIKKNELIKFFNENSIYNISKRIEEKW